MSGSYYLESRISTCGRCGSLELIASVIHGLSSTTDELIPVARRSNDFPLLTGRLFLHRFRRNNVLVLALYRQYTHTVLHLDVIPILRTSIAHVGKRRLSHERHHAHQ